MAVIHWVRLSFVINGPPGARRISPWTSRHCVSLPSSRYTRFPPRINISFRISPRCHSKTAIPASLESSSSPSSRPTCVRILAPLNDDVAATRCIPSDRHAFKLVSPGEKGRKTYVNLGDAQKGPREQGPRSCGLNMESARVVGVFGSRRKPDGDRGYNVIRLLLLSCYRDRHSKDFWEMWRCGEGVNEFVSK